MRFAPHIQLGLCALGGALIYYLWLAQPFSLRTYYQQPLLDLGKLTNNDAPGALSFALGGGASFALYLIAYRAAKRLDDARLHHLHHLHHLAFVLAIMLCHALILSSVYPIGANDVYEYVFHGRLWGYYNFNPLVVAPLQVDDDPWFPYLVWIWHGSPYGPLWAWFSLGIYTLAGESLWLNLMGYKLLALICLVCCALLIYDLLRARHNPAALSGVVLFAWNPLLLFEAVVNAHNDLVMIMWIVLALWLWQRQKHTRALTCATLAALIKISALVWWPVLFVAGLSAYSYHRNAAQSQPRMTSIFRVYLPLGLARFGLNAALACGLTTLIVYAPLWAGQRTFESLAPLSARFTSSLAAVVKLSLQLLVGEPTAIEWTRNLMSALFLPLYVYVLWRIRRDPLDDAFALHRRLFDVYALFLCVPTLWFQPWYLIGLLALSPLADETRRQAAIIWSMGALAMYWVFNFGWYWWPLFFNAGEGVVINLTVWLTWAAPLLAHFVTTKARRRFVQRPCD